MVNYLLVWLKSKSIEEYGIFFLTLAIAGYRLSVAFGNITLAVSVLCLIIYLYKTKAVCVRTMPWLYWQPFLIYAISVLPATLLSEDLLIGLRWVFKNVFFNASAFWIIVVMCNDQKLLKASVKGFSAVILVEAIYVIVIYHMGLAPRTRGFGGEVLGYGCVLCMVFSTLLVIALDEEFSKNLRRKVSVGIAIVAYALLTTGSRGGFGTFVIVAICMAVKYLWHDKHKLMGMGAVCLVILTIIAFNPGFQDRIKSTRDLQQCSFYSRYVAWEAGYHMMLKHPIKGIGPGTWDKHYNEYYDKRPGTEWVPHAHSNVIQIMAETGLPGLIGYLTLMCSFFVYNIGKLKCRWNVYRFMILGVLFTLNLYGIIDYTIGIRSTARTFWYLMGILSVLAETEDKEID